MYLVQNQFNFPPSVEFHAFRCGIPQNYLAKSFGFALFALSSRTKKMLMKLMYPIFASAILVLSCVSQKDTTKLNSQNFEADSTVVRILGKEILNGIAQADSVVAYTLKGQDSTAKSIAGYKIAKRIGQTDRSFYGVLQFWVTDGNNYRWQMHNKCVISPVAAFVFWQKGKSTTVLLDPYCEKWVFVRDSLRHETEITNPKSLEKYLRAMYNGLQSVQSGRLKQTYSQ
jgi:hypothetical protein